MNPRGPEPGEVSEARQQERAAGTREPAQEAPAVMDDHGAGVCNGRAVAVWSGTKDALRPAPDGLPYDGREHRDHRWDPLRTHDRNRDHDDRARPDLRLPS